MNKMGMKDKIFYWLKLKRDFVDSPTVDFLMSQPNGAEYIVLYLMICLKTINTHGELASNINGVLIPFDAERIQRECKFFSLDTIKVAFDLYTKLGLILLEDNGIMRIADFQSMVGSETYWAQQKRQQRLEKPVQKVLDVQKVIPSDDDVQKLIDKILETAKSDAKYIYDRYEKAEISGRAGQVVGHMIDILPGILQHYTEDEIIKLIKKSGKTFANRPSYTGCDISWVLDNLDRIEALDEVAPSSKTEHFSSEHTYTEEDMRNLLDDVNTLEF